MKQRWKKIGSLVSIGVLVFSLSACGQTKDEINAKVQDNLYQGTVGTVQALVQYDKATIEQSIEEIRTWTTSQKMPSLPGLIP